MQSDTRKANIMIKNLYLVGIAAVSMTAAAMAQAEEHPVIVTGFSYFPAVVYAQPGDTIRFINNSGEQQTVVGKDTGWVVGPLQDLEEGTLLVEEETELAFYAAYEEEGEQPVEGANEHGSYEGAPIKAEITFDEPPLNDQSDS